MNKVKITIVTLSLLILSACAQSERKEDSRILDLNGRGLVTYQIKRSEVDGMPTAGRIENVSTIRFYEGYIMVEVRDAARLFNTNDLISFEWKK